MRSRKIKWCPQHGYPEPCHKCGISLSTVSPKEIYEKGRQAGIKEVVEWIEEYGRMTYERGRGEVTFNHINWQSKLKEWRKE